MDIRSLFLESRIMASLIGIFSNFIFYFLDIIYVNIIYEDILNLLYKLNENIFWHF